MTGLVLGCPIKVMLRTDCCKLSEAFNTRKAYTLQSWCNRDIVLLQFHGQDGLGDAPSIHPALESISHSPLQGIAALELVEVSSLIASEFCTASPE